MLIAKEDFNNDKVFEVYQAAFMSPEKQDDGSVKVVIDGMKVFAEAMADRPFFVLRAMFGLQETASRSQVLELCNRINDHMIMVRCCYPEASPRPLLWFDHFTMTEGGITGEEIIGLTRRMASVVTDAMAGYDKENIVK